jgi:putative ATP-dependent endonuclease of OLD family
LFQGNGNSEGMDASGLSLKIEFDEKYRAEYEEIVAQKKINTIPIEYYEVSWTSFVSALTVPRLTAIS